jgi:hypothetical protein
MMGAFHFWGEKWQDQQTLPEQAVMYIKEEDRPPPRSKKEHEATTGRHPSEVDSRG